MTLRDLIDLYRAQSLDEAKAVSGGDSDVFCSDDLLTIYANEAQDEACRRGRLLRDAASPMCTLAYAAGAASVVLDQRIVQVLQAFIDGRPVSIVSAQEMASTMPTWMAPSSDVRPRVLVAGMTDGQLHLWPTPSQAGEIKLQVQRLPLKPMRNDTDRPEIRPEAHRALVPWMLYRAFSRMDTDLHDDARAAAQLALFVSEFGGKAGVRNEEWVRRGVELMPSPIA